MPQKGMFKVQTVRRLFRPTIHERVREIASIMILPLSGSTPPGSFFSFFGLHMFYIVRDPLLAKFRLCERLDPVRDNSSARFAKILSAKNSAFPST